LCIKGWEPELGSRWGPIKLPGYHFLLTKSSHDAWFREWWELGCLVFSPGMGSSDNWRYSWGWEPTWKPGHFSHPPENRPTLICHLYHSFLMINFFLIKKWWKEQEMVSLIFKGKRSRLVGQSFIFFWFFSVPSNSCSFPSPIPTLSLRHLEL